MLSAHIPTREAIAAWAAAASTAGAVLPGRVARILDTFPWDNYGSQYPSGGEEIDPDDLLDAYSILQAVAAACRSIYREDPSHYPMPRGMEVFIDPEGRVALIWGSDSHTVALRFGSGWSTADMPGRGGPNQAPHWAPNLSEARLDIEGDFELDESPRVAAAVAASPTLQQQGWD